MDNYFSKNLRGLRLSKGWTQEKLAKKIGTTRSSVANWENGFNEPNFGYVRKLQELFDIDKNIITDNLSELNFENAALIDIETDMIHIPVLGIIPAGVPIEAIENILGYESIPREWTKDNMEYFGLKIEGNSMNPEYKDKDTIIVLKQDYCESGQDCVVSVDGNNAVFKRIVKQGDNIILKPLNNEYEPVMYTKEDIEKLPIRILGIAKEVRRKLR